MSLRTNKGKLKSMLNGMKIKTQNIKICGMSRRHLLEGH